MTNHDKLGGGTTTDPVLETGAGRVEGVSDGNVVRFLGIPYGQAARFLPATSPAPWVGTFKADTRGPRCPQVPRGSKGAWLSFLGDPTPTGEDCLCLNVYAPAAPASRPRPVLVWLHGGGYVSGTGGHRSCEGSRLAEHGDAVVVALNHRLNAFGFTYFGDIIPGHQGSNVGLTDIILALEWVRDNIAQLGGDPDNVTIFGQSGGGSKVALMMAMPGAEGLFHRAVIQSASSLLAMATPERATRCAALLLEELGIDDPTPDALGRPSPAEILAARLRAVERNGGLDDFRPVVDGVTLPADPFEPMSIERSAHVPLMIGTCEEEMTFFLATGNEDFDQMDESEAQARLAKFIASGPESTLYDDLAALYPGEVPGQILAVAMSEHMYRRNDRLAADRRADHGGAPVFNYLVSWKTAALSGKLRSPHTLCIPLAFGNTKAAAKLLGRPDEADALAVRMMDAWLSFARNGNPNHPGIPAWQPYDSAHRATMIFDDQCVMVNDPLPELRQLIDACPAYSVAKGAEAARQGI